MARCIRCCLLKSIKIINLLQNLCGVVMIIYSLWLLKKWQIGISQISSTSHLPKPWFVYTCLGVGIAVCLSTLFGHIVVKCLKNCILCIYIVAICCLLLVEVAAIIIIFFKFEWQVLLLEHIDEKHAEFKSLLIINIKICRWIVILILIPQVNVIVLAIILWGVGISEPRRRSAYLVMPNFNRSFLLDTSSPLLEHTAQNCRNCEILRAENPGDGFLSHIRNTIRTRLEEAGRHGNNGINCN